MCKKDDERINVKKYKIIVGDMLIIIVGFDEVENVCEKKWRQVEKKLSKRRKMVKEFYIRKNV